MVAKDLSLIAIRDRAGCRVDAPPHDQPSNLAGCADGLVADSLAESLANRCSCAPSVVLGSWPTRTPWRAQSAVTVAAAHRQHRRCRDS